MAHDPLDPENDPFGPPAISTIVHCLHCGEEYDSYRIEWRVEHDADGAVSGFWCCPMDGCEGKGFGFDIFPVDPDYRDENGERMWCRSAFDEPTDDGDFDDDVLLVDDSLTDELFDGCLLDDVLVEEGLLEDAELSDDDFLLLDEDMLAGTPPLAAADSNLLGGDDWLRAWFPDEESSSPAARPERDDDATC